MAGFQLQITLLGEFSLGIDGEPASVFTGDRPISLLAYLLLHRHTAVSRQHLAYTLWPDSSDSQARTNLRSLFFNLRQALPGADTYLVSDSLTLQWRPDANFSLDVAEFEAALSAAKTAAARADKIGWLEKAVFLYRGDLLPGSYEDWIIPIRETLRQQVRDVLQQLVALLEESGDYRAAARTCQRWIQDDPLDETAYVQLMRLHAFSGARSKVHRVYEQCTAVLRRELGVEPDPATREAYNQYLRVNLSQVSPGRSTAAAPPQTGAGPPNLPQTGTIFVGRQKELAEITSLITGTSSPLLTIVGPGGAGKTRLAVRAAAELAPQFPNGVVFVSLASVLYPESVPSSMAAALRISLNGGANPEDEIIRFLGDRDILIILDNLEHLLDAAPFIARITQQAPGVRLLATSRERLRVQAEWVFKLGGLDVPPDPIPADIASYEAVRLFVERARRTGRDFALTGQNQVTVAQICRRLDGLPLALELAAAQMSFLTLDGLLQRLDQALPLLVDGARDLPERQRTIRATIEWSINLLSDDERTLFIRLAVFMGGFTLEMAETVCAGEHIEAGQVLPLLRGLVERSLLLQEEAEGSVRFRFLEPIRQYAVEQLAASGQAAAQADRHATFFLALAEEAAPKLQSVEQVEWLAHLAREFPNLRAAMRWILEQQDVERASRLCWDLWVFLWLRGHLSVGRRWVEQLLPAAEKADPPVRGRVLLSGMVIGFGQGDHAWAAAFIEECLSIYRALDDPLYLAHTTSLAGLILAGERRLEAAEPLMALAVQQYIDVDSKWNAAMLLSFWAAIPRSQGDYRQAQHLTERALDLAKQQGDRVTMYSSLFNLALLAQAQGALDEALGHFRQALALAVEVGDSGNFIPCLEGVADVAAAQGDIPYAVRIWRAAAAFMEGSEAAIYMYAPDRSQVAEAIENARRRLPAETWWALWHDGPALNLEQALHQALHMAPVPSGEPAGRTKRG